jgi:hypothetical protein
MTLDLRPELHESLVADDLDRSVAYVAAEPVFGTSFGPSCFGQWCFLEASDEGTTHEVVCWDFVAGND